MSETVAPPLKVIEADTELEHEPRFPVPPRPETHVGAEAGPAVPVVALIVGLIALCVTSTGLGFGIANFLNGKASVAKLSDKLDALLLGQKDILDELARLRGEVEWTQILTLIAQPVQRIKYFIDEMRRLLPPADWDKAKIDAWLKEKEHEIKEWAKAALALNDGLRQQLSYIDTAFQGGGGLTKPLVAVLIEKMTINKFKTQSAYFMVCLAYRSLKEYEAQALGALAGAYKIEHPDATEPQVKDYIQPYQDVYQKQIEDTLPLLTPLNRFWTQRWNGIGADAPIMWTQWHVVYGDNHQVKTQDGCVLVGLQIYKKGNRVALEITQAQLDVSGDINASSKKTITNQEWGESYIQIGANTEIQLMTTVVPSQCMATGVQLWLDGNKLMVLLEYVPFDFTTRTADFSKRKWTTAAEATASPNNVKWYSSDPDGKVGSDSDRGRVGTMYDVTPDPLSPITGVMLDMAKTGWNVGHFMLARIKTDFYGPDKPTKKSA
jgi:hypothetical protein